MAAAGRTPADRPAPRSGTLSGPVHDRVRDAREVPASPDPAASRDPKRRSGRHLRPRRGAYETRIRFETDKTPSRHIPNAVKRAVWRRDEGQCAFVATTGRRCGERNFLEFQPYALEGPATAGNISLRCRRHNAFEAELV